MLSKKDYAFITARVPLACVDLLLEENGQFLVCKRKIEPGKGSWILPGGRIYKGETFEVAINRKAKEELGIEVDIVRQLGSYVAFCSEYHTVTTIFLCHRKGSLPITLDFQHSEYMWVKNSNYDLEQHFREAIETARHWAKREIGGCTT